MDKNLIFALKKVRREYSEVEAMFSYSLDVNCGKTRSLRSYERMWSWSKGRVKRFIERVNVNGPATDQQRTSNGPAYKLILLDNQNGADQQRTSNGPATDHKYKEQEEERDNMSGKDAQPAIPYAKIISYFNEKTKSSFKPTSKATKALIRSRWNEGFREKDFQKVIDYKFQEWGANDKMVTYLRPQTIFGTKFESYLQAADKGTIGKGCNDCNYSLHGCNKNKPDCKSWRPIV